jgi:hypothetical protein
MSQNTKTKNINNINSFIESFNNKPLIENIIKTAKYKFKQNGLYMDAYIIKEYIANRGTFNNINAEHNIYENPYFNKIIRFLAEMWIDVNKYLDEHHISTLEELQHAKYTRPLMRIDNDTPITLIELLKLHSKKKLLELCKNNNGYRINWRLGDYLKNKNNI